MSAICDAIQGLNLIELHYDGYGRVVEPHAYGSTSKGHDVLRAYQISGGSQSGQSRGWKLLRLDEAYSVNALGDTFQGSRNGYRRNDSAMSTIYCQL